MFRAQMLLAMAAGVALGGCATGKSNREISSLKGELRQNEAQCAKTEARDAAKIEELTKSIKGLSADLKDEISKGQVTINQSRNQVTLSVMQEVLFDSGRTELREPGVQVLEKVAKAIQGLSGQWVTIQGHTDNVPIGASIIARYPTNWELSTARSTTVVRYLQDKGVKPQDLGASGFGEYRPVASNDTEEGRQRNRRIDVVLSPAYPEWAGIPLVSQ